MRILRIATIMKSDIEARITRLGFTVFGDYEVLSAVRRAPRQLLPSEIAGRLMLTRAGVTGRLDRLEGQGLVERQRSGADARNVLVRLTPKGRRLTDKAMNEIVTCQNELFSGLSDIEARAALLVAPHGRGQRRSPASGRPCERLKLVSRPRFASPIRPGQTRVRV